MLSTWKIAPALAAGCTVVHKPAELSPLSAMLLAEIAQKSEIPDGVWNTVNGMGEVVGKRLTEHPAIKAVALVGETATGSHIMRQGADTLKRVHFELGGKNPVIVFEDADLDSAVEGLVDAIWFNQGQVCCAGSRLLVQEGIADTFYRKLKTRMDGLRIGDPLDKCIDVGAIVDPVQRAMIADMVAANDEGEVYQTAAPDGCYYPPTLITGLTTSSKLMQEEIFGPVLVSTTFRTPVEAVAMANDTRYGLAATVWTENVNLALDIAPQLVAGVVWVNSTNLMDAAAGFGGVRDSGYGREGGSEGLDNYMTIKNVWHASNIV